MDGRCGAPAAALFFSSKKKTGFPRVRLRSLPLKPHLLFIAQLDHSGNTIWRPC